MNKIIWVDVETSGLCPIEDQIIELAAIYEHGDVQDTFHMYCKPAIHKVFDVGGKGNKFPSWLKIEKLTGITWEFLCEKGVPEEDMYLAFLNWLSKKILKYDKKDKAIFAAYNASFDNNFLRALWEKYNDNYFGSFFRAGCLDVLSSVLTCLWLGKLTAPPNFKLGTVIHHVGLKLDKAHSAIEDIKVTRELQKHLNSLLK